MFKEVNNVWIARVIHDREGKIKAVAEDLA